MPMEHCHQVRRCQHTCFHRKYEVGWQRMTTAIQARLQELLHAQSNMRRTLFWKNRFRKKGLCNDVHIVTAHAHHWKNLIDLRPKKNQTYQQTPKEVLHSFEFLWAANQSGFIPPSRTIISKTIFNLICPVLQRIWSADQRQTQPLNA